MSLLLLFSGGGAPTIESGAFAADGAAAVAMVGQAMLVVPGACAMAGAATVSFVGQDAAIITEPTTSEGARQSVRKVRRADRLFRSQRRKVFEYY